MFGKCPHSLDVATPARYECDIKKMENNSTEEISIVPPPLLYVIPGYWDFHLVFSGPLYAVKEHPHNSWYAVLSTQNKHISISKRKKIHHSHGLV